MKIGVGATLTSGSSLRRCMLFNKSERYMDERLSKTHLTDECRWVALSVIPNYERAVERALRKRSLNAYVPVRWERHKWSDRIKDVAVVLFPGYVFCRMKGSDGLRVLRLP